MKTFNFWLALAALLLVSFVFSVLPASGQELVQTVRGEIIDKNIRTPLPGAAVTITDLQPVKGASSDADGKFKITNVPVGRRTIRISLLGYEEIVLRDVIVSSGKETVLMIPMEEKIVRGNEVEIVAETDKRKPLNEMATVSARTFSVEETQRFAAAVNDPARMALAYAGVQSVGDGNNIITIRGNSPNGLLWRMEGIDIPNPNHFSSVGSAGGGISILSAQLLSNSDFMTGAFPAEYGNAVSGVFDLHLRKGNNEKREFTAQIGVLGTDIAAEGPFRKNGNGGSYLINYRYSTLSILGKLGVLDDNGITNFQDLSFNLFMPTKKAGTFTLFGFGGLSSEVYKAKKDSALWETDPDRQYYSIFYANTGAVGLTHALQIGKDTYLKSSLSASLTGNGERYGKLQSDFSEQQLFDGGYNQSKILLSSVLNHRINTQHLIRTGFTVSNLFYNLGEKIYDDSLHVTHETVKGKGTTQLLQGFGQWQYRPSATLTLNAGLHALLLTLNNTGSVEPRAGIKWNFLPTHALTLGYGLHGQIQPMGVYFAKVDTGAVREPNKNLGFTKAHHLVAGYEKLLGEHTHLRIEVYRQWLFNVPVSTDPTLRFSTLNVIDGYVTLPLVNKGKGRNTGIELTAERMFHKGWYALLSGSLYNSEYAALDGAWRNSRFNGNYAATFTSGKEIVFKEHFKNRTLGLNLKVIWCGGFRETPIDVTASKAQGEEVLFSNREYEEKVPDYFRIDTRISLRRNWKNYTSEFAFDLQNATNRENVFNRYWDSTKNEIVNSTQAPLIPVLSWKAEF